MLNFAAFSAALAIGAHQLWLSGARSYAMALVLGSFAAFLSIFFVVFQPCADPEHPPLLSFCRTQANLRRLASEQPLRYPRPNFRAFLVSALLASAPTAASLAHDRPVVQHL
eukprot:6184262-Pleurochrysis_carterae.AAC.3